MKPEAAFTNACGFLVVVQGHGNRSVRRILLDIFAGVRFSKFSEIR